MKRLLLLLSLSLPLFAAGRDLGPRNIAPTAYDALFPRVAANDNRFLTVWRESMEVLGTHIKGAFSDASGRRLSPIALTLVQDVQPEWLEAVGTGDSFAIFWRRGAVTSMADVDHDGRVTNVRTLDLPLHIGSRVAWNGTHFLIALDAVFTERGQAVLLERDGDVVRRDDLDSVGMFFAVVPRTDGFVVLSSGVQLIAHRITANGVISREHIAGTFPPGTMSRPLEVVAAPAAGGTLVVFSYGTYGPGTSDLQSALVRNDGSVTDEQLVLRREGIVTPHGLLRDGNGFVLAYTEQSATHMSAKLMTLRLDANGAAAGSAIEGPQTRPMLGAATLGSVMLVAASTDVQFTNRVSANVIGSDGVPRAPEMLSLQYARQHQPILGAGNGRFLAMWSEHEGDAAYLRSALLARDGTPSARPAAALSFLTSRDLAWSGTDYLAVHRSDGKLMATRIDANGAPIDAQPIILAAQNTYAWWESVAAVTWAGTHWIVVWPDERWQLVIAFVSPNGVASTPRVLDLRRPQLPEEQFRIASDVAIAYDGTRALLVWNEALHEICYFPICGHLDDFTLATYLSPDDGVVLDAPIEVPYGYDPSVAASGREFMIVSGNNVTVVDGAPLRIVKTGTLPGIAGPSGVAFDGRDFLVAVRYQVANWYLRMHRLDAELNGTVAGVVTQGPDRHTAPSIAATTSGDALIAIQEGDAATGARATVYREDELQPLPAPPGTPANVRLTSTATAYTLTWDPPEGSVVEQYYIEEISPEGFLHRAAYAGPHVRQVTSPYRNIRVRARNAGGESAPTELLPSRRRAVGR